MAQQLLVERGDKSVVPALRKIAISGTDSRARLKALWVLDAFDLEHLGWIRTHYFRHLPNVTLDDEETAAFEVDLYKAAGGGTIVDVTTPGIGRDPLALARL